VDGNLLKPEANGGKIASVAGDDDVLVIDHDWLAESELPNRLGDRIDGRVAVPGVLFVGDEFFEGNEGDFQGWDSLGSGRETGKTSGFCQFPAYPCKP